MIKQRGTDYPLFAGGSEETELTELNCQAHDS